MLLIHRLIGLVDLSLSSVLLLPCVHSWPQNLDIVMLSGYAPVLQDVSNHFEHLQLLCYPSHPRFLNSLMHLQIFPPCSAVFRARLSTLIDVLRYSVALTCMLELVL